jgi:positive regulator of sigma E activity
MKRTAMVESTEDKILVKNNDIPASKISSSGKFWGVSERSYAVNNPSGFELASGDTVELMLPPGRTVISTGITFLFPLLLFPVSYTLAQRFWPGMSEGGRFFIGCGALLAGLPLGAMIRRLAVKSGGLTAVPEIVRVLTPAELLDCRLNPDSCGSCKLCSG